VLAACSGGAGEEGRPGSDAAGGDVWRDAGLDGIATDGVAAEQQSDWTVDHGVAEDVPEEIGWDFLIEPDGDAGDQGGPKPGDFGAPCKSGGNCDSGLCILTANGMQCTMPCVDDCPQGWSCVLYEPSRPDEVYICAQPLVSLCRPCKLNVDCQAGGLDPEAACVSYGDLGAFCGGPCEGTDDCPDGYDCKQAGDVSGGWTKQCARTDIECPCTKVFTDEGATTDCWVENDFGKCVGQRACAAAGLTACSAMVPEEETCNSSDDDCDGLVDEDLKEAACLVINTYGTCPGMEACIGGKKLCEGTAAKPETCDGEDNDCDGTKDEGFEDTDGDGIADCLVNDKDGDGVVDGLDNCPVDFNPQQADFDLDTAGDPCDPDDDNDLVADADDCAAKDPAAHPGAAEVCDGLDNDCDFVVDEGFPDIDYDGLKGCTDDDDDGDGTVDGLDCAPEDASINPQAPELCDAKDNDCDSVTDEGFDGIACGKGACLHLVPECLAGVLQVCDPLDGASIEACDGIDNDCDGMSDEEFGKTTCGLGVCAHTIETCLAGKPAVCDPKEGAGMEVCDGLDNDCDGLTDEELGELACGKGICFHAVKACQGGVPQFCNPTEGAKPEVCDLADNDCDGQVDEDSGVLSCGKGACKHQQAYCVDGKIKVCDPYEAATPEVCDAVDNDCDGLTDEDQGKTACGLGVCAHTIENCAAGKPQVCDPQEGAAVEACDGVDNDCDGKIDEELGQLACGKGTCFHTLKACIGGEAQQCDPLEGAKPEVCDGVDNDCDGATDEDLGTVNCGKGACLHVMQYCTNGKVAICDPFDGVSPELCDGEDNDCDGLKDEEMGLTSCGVGACFHLQEKCVNGVEQVCDPFQGAGQEACDGDDNDCDGVIDPDGAIGCTDFYMDADDDGFGAGAPVCRCQPQAPYTASASGDCDDENMLVNPGMAEDCYTGADEDCTGGGNDGCIYPTCYKIMQNVVGAKSGAHEIDTDGLGPKPPFTVTCDMESDGGGWTVFHHNMEQKFHVKGYESPGSFSAYPAYDATTAQMNDVLGLSASAKQHLLKDCKGSLIQSGGEQYSWFTNGLSQKVSYWPGGSANCDINDYAWRQDGGWITKPSDLPVTGIFVGDTGDGDEEADITLGALYCR